MLASGYGHWSAYCLRISVDNAAGGDLPPASFGNSAAQDRKNCRAIKQTAADTYGFLCRSVLIVECLNMFDAVFLVPELGVVF